MQMRNVNKEYARTFSGDSLYFRDLSVCIFHDFWCKNYMVIVYRPGTCVSNDSKIASFSFDNLEDAVEICEYVLIKIALAEALFGWSL
jgi:hypothetical protein